MSMQHLLISMLLLFPPRRFQATHVTALRIEVGRDEQHHKSAYFCVSTLQTQQTRSEQNNLEVMSLEYLLSLFTIKCIQLSV